MNDRNSKRNVFNPYLKRYAHCTIPQAMAAAEVGDDVMVEDPTVNELERYANLHTKAFCFIDKGSAVPQYTEDICFAMPTFAI
jgi:hypothetical protein